METDAKTLYYSLLKLKYSPSIYLKHKKTPKKKNICIFKQQPQKTHEQDILAAEKSSNRSIVLCVQSHGTHFMNYFASLGIFTR